MAWMTLRALALALTLSAATSADAAAVKDAKADRVDIEYVAPKSPEHQPVLELIKEHRTLERIQQLLRPLRLPRRLLIKTEGCDLSLIHI